MASFLNFSCCRCHRGEDRVKRTNNKGRNKVPAQNREDGVLLEAVHSKYLLWVAVAIVRYRKVLLYSSACGGDLFG